MSLDEHLDLPKCKHKGCEKPVYMNAEGTLWKYCHDHRMDYFKPEKK